MNTCYCDRCSEPDPICEHGVSTHDEDCPTCAAVADELCDEELDRLRAELRVVDTRRRALRDRIEHLTGVRP